MSAFRVVSWVWRVEILLERRWDAGVVWAGEVKGSGGGSGGVLAVASDLIGRGGWVEVLDAGCAGCGSCAWDGDGP